MCLISVDGMREKNGNVTRIRNASTKVMNAAPAANDTYLASFCFRAASLGRGSGFVAVTILLQRIAAHRLLDPAAPPGHL